MYIHVYIYMCNMKVKSKEKASVFVGQSSSILDIYQQHPVKVPSPKLKRGLTQQSASDKSVGCSAM